MVTIEELRPLARGLPRTEERLVRDRVTFRVGRIVYVGFSRDETIMGFAFPREERQWLVDGEPDTYLLPRPGEMRWNWVLARLAALDRPEAEGLVVDAWRMVVPRRLAAAYSPPRSG
jgi:hypothetical protein